MANLFIGGPIDGQIREVPAGYQFIEVAVTPNNAILCDPSGAGPARAVKVETVRYSRFYIEHGDGGADVLFRPVGQTNGETFKLLLENYRPNGVKNHD